MPRNRGKNTTLIAALSLEGMGAAMILEGSANTTAFDLSVEQVLAPSLRAGQIVIMDNLQAHKSAQVKQATLRERLSTPLLDLAIHLISPPLSKPSRSSKLRGSEQEREHEKRCK